MLPICRREKDPQTGLEVCYLTDWDEPSRKTYFSNESWTSDDRAVIFLSERGGTDTTPQRVWMAIDGEYVLLTEGEGWHAASFGISRSEDVGYAVRDGQIWRMDLRSGKTSPFAALPFQGQPTGHLTCTRSGHVVGGYRLKRGYYVLAITDERGETQTLMRSDTPLGHVQACPADDRTVFYVHETGGDAVQRTWLYDIELRETRPFFVEAEDDWITHETWDFHGQYITFIRDPHAIMRGDRTGQSFETVVEGEFHHCAPSPTDRWIIADRTRTGEILLVEVGTKQVQTLAVGHRATRGEDHCHPSFNRKGTKVLFTAPMNGRPQVALIDLEQIEGFTP